VPSAKCRASLTLQKRPTRSGSRRTEVLCPRDVYTQLKKLAEATTFDLVMTDRGETLYRRCVIDISTITTWPVGFVARRSKWTRRSRALGRTRSRRSTATATFANVLELNGICPTCPSTEAHCEERASSSPLAETFRQWGVEGVRDDRFGGVSVSPYESLNLGLHVATIRLTSPRIANESLAPWHQGRSPHLRRIKCTRPYCDAQVGTSIEKADGLFSARRTSPSRSWWLTGVPILLVDPVSADFAIVHAEARLKGEVSATLSSASLTLSVRALLGPRSRRGGYQSAPKWRILSRTCPSGARRSRDRSLLDLRTSLPATGCLDYATSTCRSVKRAPTRPLPSTARAPRTVWTFALVARRSS